MTETYGSAKADGTLTVYIIGLCIAAPIAEEFVFRGFVLLGWSQSFLGPIGAVVLSSLIWAAMHTQYNLFYMFWIFSFGILLGTLRLRNGSTWLTVILHAAHNLIAIAQVALLVASV
jgi:membrane protease YdiL (CAAX protease family)